MEVDWKEPVDLEGTEEECDAGDLHGDKDTRESNEVQT